VKRIGLFLPLAVLATLAALLVGSGCTAARSGASAVRFANAPVVWEVNDRLDVPAAPAERVFARLLYHSDGYIFRAFTRALDVRAAARAADTNAIDEVPDSTWFVNRIGLRDLTVDEVRRGPNHDDSPMLHKPWTITGTKVGGLTVGFIMKDARGQKFLLKFDRKSIPEVETAADVILQRLLWATGYHVPEDDVVFFTRDDLVLAEDATVKDFFGNKRPMILADLEERLGLIEVGADGRIRGLVSKFLSGVPVGGYAREGRRKDDVNDTIPHERRRTVRGQVAIFAWLGHADIKEDNSLDMWQEDPADPERHYLVHHLVDFGTSLGMGALADHFQATGFAHHVDLSWSVRSLVSLGLVPRPWEAAEVPELPGVALFESETYDPGASRSHAPYFAHYDADRFDGFWGAKIIMRFTPEHIRAVVEEARFSDPRTTEYMTRTLIERQRKTARYWFDRVAPLDRFTVSGLAGADSGGGIEVCFDDLMMRYQLDPRAIATHYRVRSHAWSGAAVGDARVVRAAADGHTCIGGLRTGEERDDYTIVRLELRRGRTDRPAVEVHVARAPDTGTWRVIGVHRE
jgi:hypothetical protein